MTLMDFILAAGSFVFLAIFGEGIGAFAGYVTFKVVTLGLVRVQGAKDKDIKFPWYGLARDSEGHLLIEDDAAVFFGVIVLFGFVLIYFFWKAHPTSIF